MFSKTLNRCLCYSCNLFFNFFSFNILIVNPRALSSSERTTRHVRRVRCLSNEHLTNLITMRRAYITIMESSVFTPQWIAYVTKQKNRALYDTIVLTYESAYLLTHIYNSRFILERVIEVSQVFLWDAHILPKLLSHEKHSTFQVVNQSPSDQSLLRCTGLFEFICLNFYCNSVMKGSHL
jgi:hypothetical protein